MTTRNFEEIRERLDQGTRIEPTADDRARVVARGLAKAAPFHRNRNGILAAEQELFDRIWYDRSMLHEQKAIEAGDDADLEHLRKVAGPSRARVEQTYGIENLGPYDKFEWGMLNGKLSAPSGTMTNFLPLPLLR